MDTNESLRQRALRLVNLGCSQKILAARMEMQPATFSRWLNQKGIAPVSVTALDGFNAYVRELAAALADVPDVNRQSGVQIEDEAHVSGAHGRGEPLGVRRGSDRATAAVPHGQARSVPGASSSKQLGADFERVTSDKERAAAARAARQSPAAARARTARSAARARKTSR